MALVKCHKTLYNPTFDENTGKYVDISPYKKHERNRITYGCRCDVSVTITTRQQFCSHIKSNKHQELLRNFKQYSTPTENIEKDVKQYRIDKELLRRQNVMLREKSIKLIEELTKSREENAKMVKEKEVDKKKRDSLKRSVKELNFQNKNKDNEIEKMKTEILETQERMQYLQSQLILEDDKYKEIINYE